MRAKCPHFFCPGFIITILSYTSPMFYIKRIIFYIFICCLPASQPLANTTIEASARLLNFNYEEFDGLTGQSANKETGVIPGLSIAVSKILNNYTNTIGVEVYSGQVDYDGYTQSDVPHSTVTDEKLYQLFYQLNWSLTTSSSIYGKVAWQQWDRDILPANNVSGLFEQYQWWAFEAGLLATLLENDINKWQFEFGASKISNGTIKIDLDRFGYGQPVLNLGDGYGLSAALKFLHNLSNRDQVQLSLQHRYWTFGESNSETISNGSTTIIITEPRSVSNHTILSINYRYYF